MQYIISNSSVVQNINQKTTCWIKGRKVWFGNLIIMSENLFKHKDFLTNLKSKDLKQGFFFLN